MAPHGKTSCLLLLATIFTYQVSALPFLFSVLPRAEPTLLSPSAICNQSYYNGNNTLSLIIDKANHAIIAHVFDNTCNSISDTINLTSNASGTTVTTAKGPLIITSLEVPGGESSANIARSAKNTLEKLQDTKERRSAPCGDYNGQDACSGQHYGPTNGPTTDEASQIQRRSAKDTPLEKLHDTKERRTAPCGDYNGQDACSGQHYGPTNGPTTDEAPQVQRRSDIKERQTENAGGIGGSEPVTGQVLDPHAIGNGPSTKDYTPPRRRDQETDNIIDTRIEFTFNGTSFGGILSKLDGAGCSDGGNGGSKDQCPGGKFCCHLIF